MSILLLLFTPSLHAQTTLEVVNAFPVIELDTTGIGTDSIALSALAADSLSASDLTTQNFCVKTSITVSNTTNLQNIHIRVGRTVGSSDVVNIAVPYNYTTIPAGIVTIQKNAENILVNFGIHVNVYTLYLEVWLEDSAGNLSSTYTQQIN